MAFWQAEQDNNEQGRFSYTPPQQACVGPEGRQFYMGGAAMATSRKTECSAEERDALFGRILAKNENKK